MTGPSPADLDRDDPLAPVRARFALPPEWIYLDGNSLGALPVATPDRLRKAVVEEWGEGLIGSWNGAGWYELPLTLGDRVGGLIGAEPGQVAVCDTTTVNLYKAMSAALTLRPDRSVIVMDSADFPTNLYVAEGVARGAAEGVAGGVGAVDRLRRRLLEPGEDPRRALDGSVAVLALSHVNFRSGEIADLEHLTAAAHDVGALVIWDLCHSAGILPVGLDAAGVDFAVGCTYKFLNGGPGAPAWIYVATRHLRRGARQPLTGWMGHAAPFDFAREYRPDPGIRGFLCGTPHILSMRGVEAGLDTFDGVRLEDVRAKAASLTDLFVRRVESGLPPETLRLVSPRDAGRRGAQVSFEFEHGYAVVQALIARGVVGDYREPAVMRFGFAPLYLSHADVARAADELIDCVRGEVWTDPSFSQRSTVT